MVRSLSVNELDNIYHSTDKVVKADNQRAMGSNSVEAVMKQKLIFFTYGTQSGNRNPIALHSRNT
jgi:hypothetical protein